MSPNYMYMYVHFATYSGTCIIIHVHVHVHLYFCTYQLHNSCYYYSMYVGLLLRPTIQAYHSGLPLRPATQACHSGLPLRPTTQACHSGLPLRPACHSGWNMIECVVWLCRTLQKSSCLLILSTTSSLEVRRSFLRRRKWLRWRSLENQVHVGLHVYMYMHTGLHVYMYEYVSWTMLCCTTDHVRKCMRCVYTHVCVTTKHL